MSWATGLSAIAAWFGVASFERLAIASAIDPFIRTGADIAGRATGLSAIAAWFGIATLSKGRRCSEH